MRFENLLSRSWAILRRHLWLWPLALLAGESAGGGGSGGSGFNSAAPRTSGSVSAPDFSWVPGWLSDRATLLLEVGLAVFAGLLILFLISCVAEGALVGASGRIDAGERVGFGAAWRSGLTTFWRVLGFKLFQLVLHLLLLVPLVLIPLVGAAVGKTDGFIKGLLLDLPLALFAPFYLFVVGGLAVVALRACVLDGRGPVAAFGSAYRLVLRRFSRVALTALLLAAVGFGVGILFQVILSLIAVPFSGPLVNAVAAGRWNDFLAELGTLAAVTIPVGIVLGSLAGAYFAVAWTVAYRRFDLDGEVPEPEPLAL